jgi:hypothetical protein
VQVGNHERNPSAPPADFIPVGRGSIVHLAHATTHRMYRPIMLCHQDLTH